MKPGKALNTDCAWGCKKNSLGNVSFWKGYKLHLDVTEMGIPVTAILTGRTSMILRSPFSWEN